MGRRSLSGGVRAKGTDRIEFVFVYRGNRYRPSVSRPPTEANLRRARIQLADIRQRIRYGTFNFLEEFPDYRYAEELARSLAAPASVSDPTPRPPAPAQSATVPERATSAPADAPESRTCKTVFDAFLRYCQMRVRGDDLVFSTASEYRKILERTWCPKLGPRRFLSIKYSDLVAIASAQDWKTKKTYNNGVSALRCAFAFGYKDHPESADPAKGLDGFRIAKKDRRKVDPFTLPEAERLLRAIHLEWGGSDRQLRRVPLLHRPASVRADCPHHARL